MKYDKYKDSGVEWIGEIPEGWEVSSLKHCVGIRITDGPHETPEFLLEGVPFVSAEAIQDGSINFDSVRGYISEEEDMRFSLKCKPQKNDIFIVKSGSTTGKIGYVHTEINFNIWSPLALVRANKANYSRYLYHYLQSVLFQTQVQLSWSFGTQPNIGMNVIENLKIIVPNLPEQTTIASFLDRKTAEIDQLIANKEKLIALYEEEKTAIINRAVTKGLVPDVKTKPSGIEWLGDIPEHWEVKRLKRLCSIISKGTTPSTIGREILAIGDIRFIKAENVLNNKVVAEPANFIDQKTNDMICRSQLEESDILFVIAGATIGKVAILPLELCPANTNQAVSFIRLNNKENVLFVWYWLQSDFIRKILWLDAVQSAQPNLSMENLGNFHIPFPTITEQTTIVTHIETECSRLDTIIDKFKKQIELFKEYRTTLISEVVTGKIDVRGGVAE